MAYVKIENGVVVSKSCSPGDGFIEAPDNVVCGFNQNPDGSFSAPTQAASVKRRGEILSRLAEIDIESIRALRSKTVGRGNQHDDTKLTALEDEAGNLRTELASLG